MSFELTEEKRARLMESLKKRGASDACANAIIEGFYAPPKSLEEHITEMIEMDRHLQALQANLKRQLSQVPLNPPPGSCSSEAPEPTLPETSFEVHGHRKDQSCPTQKTPEAEDASPCGTICPACGRPFQCSPSVFESRRPSPASDFEVVPDRPSENHAALIKGASSTEGGAS